MDIPSHSPEEHSSRVEVEDIVCSEGGIISSLDTDEKLATYMYHGAVGFVNHQDDNIVS